MGQIDKFTLSGGGGGGGGREGDLMTSEEIKISRECINSRGKRTVNCYWSMFFLHFFIFLLNAPYKIILFCHRLGREISQKGAILGI